jgi:hypothetical protein
MIAGYPAWDLEKVAIGKDNVLPLRLRGVMFTDFREKVVL